MIFLFLVFFNTLTKSSFGAVRATANTLRNAPADLMVPRDSSLRRDLFSFTVLTNWKTETKWSLDFLNEHKGLLITGLCFANFINENVV